MGKSSRTVRCKEARKISASPRLETCLAEADSRDPGLGSVDGLPCRAVPFGLRKNDEHDLPHDLARDDREK